MTDQTTHRGGRVVQLRRTFPLAIAGAVMALAACLVPSTSAPQQPSGLEDIYVLRSIREQQEPAGDWCAPARTGFDPLPTDAERYFSFWSVRSRPDGKLDDAKVARVAELRGCFGPTNDRARQAFFAEIKLGGISFSGRGECLALMIDAPESGLFPVRCQLILSDLPAPFVGGVLTTNTMTTKAPFGGRTDPPGYIQASIATIRLWKQRTGR